MNLQSWFEKGMGPDEYIESMNTHKENLLHVYDNFTISSDNTIDNIANKKLRIIVLTEDWCGDAMLNIPILLRIAEQANIEVRFLLRDNNLELMDQYLTNGKSRSIPIFIFINQDGKEVAKWGPRAKKIQQFVEEATHKLPDKTADDFKEKQKEVFTFITKAFRDNEQMWYEVYNSLMETCNKIK